ncbi:MAG: TRASH domain-containing protein [Gemmataceae bacterium]
MGRPGRLALVALAVVFAVAAEPTKEKPREALKPFNDLVGSWKGTGVPEGTREERQRGFWSETIAWEWQFKGDDAWMKATIKDGKYFTQAELRPLAAANRFRLTVETPEKQSLTFEGELQDRKLTLDRSDDKTKETQRITIRLLHSNRYTYQYDVKPEGKSLFVKKYQVGATKEGEPFAAGGSGPECVISGGLGTIAVKFKDKTYYVCCTGCRDEFLSNPEKYVKEFEERKKKKN